MTLISWLRARARPARRSASDRLAEALTETTERYRALRESTARCLYAVHKLADEAAHQEAQADSAKEAARAALATGDAARSRAMVARARTALDLARAAESHRVELRARADAALEDLRALGERIAGLERERLAALASPRPLPVAYLDEAHRAADLLEAERELERELSE